MRDDLPCPCGRPDHEHITDSGWLCPAARECLCGYEIHEHWRDEYGDPVCPVLGGGDHVAIPALGGGALLAGHYAAEDGPRVILATMAGAIRGGGEGFYELNERQAVDFIEAVRAQLAAARDR